MFRSGSVRGGLLVGAASLAAASASAQDGGISMVFGLSQRFDTGWNIGLAVPAEGRTSLSTTRLSFGFTSQTPLNLLVFNASSALLIENSFETDGTVTELGSPELTFAFTREIPNAIFTATANYRRDDAEAFDDSLTALGETGTRTDQGASLRFETGRTAPFGFVVGASYEATDYQGTTDPASVDSTTVSADTAAIFRFSEVAVGTLGLSFEREEEEDAALTQTDTATVSAGLDYAVSERLDLAVSLGYVEIEEEEFGVTETTSGPIGRIGLALEMPNGVATADLSLIRTADEDDRATLLIGREMELPAGSLVARIGATRADTGGTDVIGALIWTQELPSGALVFRLERSVAFDDGDEEVVVSTVAAADWSMEVNPLASLALDLSFEVSDAPSERVEQAEFGATYNYSLTTDWTLASGVRYIIRDDLDGHAESPSVFLALSRDFEFRP